MRIALFCSIIISCIGLAACETFGSIRPDRPIEGCKSQIVTTGAEVGFTGLKWPIGGTKIFEIAGAKYTPKQLQVLTDLIMQIDQYKMSQCGVLDVALRSTPPPTFTQLQPLLSEVAKLNKQILDIGIAAKAGTAADVVVKTAEQAVEKLPATPTPITSINDVSNLDQQLPRFPTMDIAGRLDGIEESIKKLAVAKAEFEERRILVRGFAPNSVALTNEMRTRLLSELSQLSTEAPGKRIIFDVVGYADSSGAYAKNVKLGLDRARMVAEVVSLHIRPTPTVRFASSAGVAAVGTDGRRVEIFYTAYMPGGNKDT